MKDRASLCSLPLELREQIWDYVADTHDLSSVRATSRLLRHDIVSRLPGGHYPAKDDGFILVDQISVVVEPWCSDDSWLKLVLRRGKIDSVWTIKDLDTLVAAVLPRYETKQVTVEFRAPPEGSFRLAAFLILRAKLYDVCRVLGRIRTQELPRVEIWFREPKPRNSRPSRWRQSFWEDRLQQNRASRRDRRRSRHFHGVEKQRRRDLEERDRYPFFYECLMLPLILHPLWSHAAIRFDREPGPRKTSVVSGQNAILQHNDPRDSYFGPGYKALSIVNWGFCDMLQCYEESMPCQLDDCDMTYLESCAGSLDVELTDDYWYERTVGRYTPWEDGYEYLLDTKLEQVIVDFERILKVISGSPEAETLRAAILRLSNTRRSSFNLRVGFEDPIDPDISLRGVEGVDFVVANVIVVDYDEGGMEKLQTMNCFFDSGEGRGKWRWTSQRGRLVYRSLAKGEGLSWTEIHRRRATPLPQPLGEGRDWALEFVLPEELKRPRSPYEGNND